MSSQTFIDLVVAGEALPADIDDFVDKWHNDPDGELHEFLGMSWEDYGLWVERPEALRFIINNRRYDRSESVARYFADQDRPLALSARSENDLEAASIIEWLQSTGRLPKS